MTDFRVGLLGCGAIGSQLPADLPADVVLVCVDYQQVAEENLGVAAFVPGDLHADKARVVAARHRLAGRDAYALPGDVRYVLRPGLAEQLDAAILCLDNRAAIRAVCEVLWEVRHDLLVLVVTCGAASEYQVRVCVPPGTCPVCTWSAAERNAMGADFAASCAATSAPRASASAAEAAAAAGARVLAAWRSGDLRLAGLRVQRDAGEEFAFRMPEPDDDCPVAHEPLAIRTVSLAGPIATVLVRELAEAALAHAGDDADIVLGSRAVPLGGLWCATSGAISAAPLRLLPAALAAAAQGTADSAWRLLAERAVLPARELLLAPEAALTLAAWGAGHGDVFTVAGPKGCLRLACTFDWSELEQEDLDAVA